MKCNKRGKNERDSMMAEVYNEATTHHRTRRQHATLHTFYSNGAGKSTGNAQ